MSPEAKETATNWIQTAIERLGFPIVVAGVLLYSGHHMILGYIEQIKEDKEFIRTDLKEMQRTSNEVLAAVRAALERNTSVVTRNTEAYERWEHERRNYEPKISP